MNYTNATDKQLMTIINDDKYCPTHLLSGVVLELIERRLLDKIINYAARLAYGNVSFVIKHRLFITHDELIQEGHIEILKVLEKFKPGMRTFKTYIIMCLRMKFIKMQRDVNAEKRYANIGTKSVDNLPVKIHEAIFEDPFSVERHVIKKMTFEDIMSRISETDRKVILWYMEGFNKSEIATKLGKDKKLGSRIVKTAINHLERVV